MCNSCAVLKLQKTKSAIWGFLLFLKVEKKSVVMGDGGYVVVWATQKGQKRILDQWEHCVTTEISSKSASANEFN